MVLMNYLFFDIHFNRIKFSKFRITHILTLAFIYLINIIYYCFQT